jgi:hypothetical protein
MSVCTISAPNEIVLPTIVICLRDMLEPVVSDVENAPLRYHLILSTYNICVE